MNNQKWSAQTMRTLGPRSVSSFLKITLDLAFLLLVILLVLLGIDAILSAYAVFDPAPFRTWRYPNGYSVLANNAAAGASLATGCVFTLGLLAIIGRLRKIFVTLIAGQPFQAENARRLRVIGLILAALEASRYAVWAIFEFVIEAPSEYWRPNINVTALFAIGVMFVLAEIFEEGARMRKDLDLTI